MGKNKYNSLSFVMNMTLFTVFALFLVLVLLSGAGTFKNVAAASEERYSERTMLFYVSQKIRKCDRVDGVSTDIINDTPVLVLNDYYYDDYSGTSGTIQIYIYHSDGWLTEFYAFDYEAPNLDLGVKILPAESVVFEFVSDSLIEITINEKSTYVNLSSGGAA
ncbi:MAG: DUF4860 domain-containing protein [Oscillospiraceae bacterium]|nr:DUF4860 domain-containing protein [Oscillospiraceae bacterium]